VVPGRLARSRRLGSDSSTVPGQPYRAADFTAKPGRSHRQQLAKPNLMRTIDHVGFLDACATPVAERPLVAHLRRLSDVSNRREADIADRDGWRVSISQFKENEAVKVRDAIAFRETSP